ncbi:hypothetical protein [Flavobacterium sp. 3-210]
MKITKTIFFTCCFVLMTATSVVAAPAPPQPQQAASGPPPPPGAPIDQNLTVLAVCALIFGVYAIRRYNFIKKASI